MVKPLDGQLALSLFDTPKPKPERVQYATPCPIRDDCGAYHCDTGGCDGERGWCLQAQLASGVDIGEWRWNLMSKYERNARKRALS